ncbi:Nucleotide-binding universal stress protein, UspA family [Poseidonocella pacifica]|uniref:Nucleotide-binding universal stress protein, UspA family n=1 Tax=Poseidonocella pacifica TaxID=871651 RepID=A0A1I0WGM7_9RHOB|nr:universal stress protein [Poseidonocella pacifica]SFA87919.1 Nucleotide-binding universal stress protein, UspA family [Poseidonocella pacifica]
MSGKFVVGYDGSEMAKRAVSFAAARAKAQDGTIVLVHVLEWSPYSFLTPNEVEERHKRRKEELVRAETALMDPVAAKLREDGITVETQIKYGHIAETLAAISKSTGALEIIIGRNGHSPIGSRVSGSVAGNLVQTAPVPCTIVP